MNRLLEFALPCLALATANAQPAPTCGCLEVRAAPSTDRISGSLTNHCGKPISTYAVDMKVLYSDGVISTFTGMKANFLVRERLDQELPDGVGPIKVRETRRIEEFEAPQSEKAGVTALETTPTISALVFEDGSAIGDEKLIEETFRERAQVVKGIAFWLTALPGMRLRMMAADSLRECFDAPELKAEVEGGRNTIEASLKRDFYRKLMKNAEYCDRHPERYSRSEAIDVLLAYVARWHSIYEWHAQRSQ